MAKRRQPLIPHWLWPGLLAAGLILLVAALAFGSLLRHAPHSDALSLWQDDYLWHVVRFTFWQALLSALI
ncbi:thiamine/thiamine pyrophosphate ABC transporter permease ThiP, partial [Serratia rubidaea]|nr:thiamine/thiamine pyrophosphate ABC transporter permease ThiP [Serratia rubidaea]